MSRTVISTQGQVVDQIALAAYGVTAGTTEAILDANPTLGDAGPVLAAGISILLPDIEAPTEAPMVQLWDEDVSIIAAVTTPYGILDFSVADQSGLLTLGV